MKTYRQKITNAITTGTAGFMVVLLSTQGVASTVSAQAAATNTQNSAATLMQQISTEMSRRSDTLSKLQLTTPDKATATDTTKSEFAITASECKDVPKDLVDKTQKTVDKSQGQSDSITKALQGNNSLAGLQTQAKTADSSYSDFQIAATQGSVMDNLCNQDKAKAQLDDLITQAQSLIDEQSSSGGSSSGSSSGGGGDIDAQEMLTQIIQLVAALATIIVSIVALITALINGDYAAAMVIFTTIIGQLATSSSVISQAISAATSLIEQLGGSVSLEAGSTD